MRVQGQESLQIYKHVAGEQVEAQECQGQTLSRKSWSCRVDLYLDLHADIESNPKARQRQLLHPHSDPSSSISRTSLA
jgi:hypothetical protein